MTTDAQPKQRLNAAQRHSASVAANKPPPKVWKARPLKDVRLFINKYGEWRIMISKGKSMPASDAEVWLWLELIKARACAAASQKAKQAHTESEDE